jgi:hypothetical protein
VSINSSPESELQSSEDEPDSIPTVQSFELSKYYFVFAEAEITKLSAINFYSIMQAMLVRRILGMWWLSAVSIFNVAD